MSKRKMWDELAPTTRARRFEQIAANHLPTVRSVVTMAHKHRKCADGANCTGPGCRVRRARTAQALELMTTWATQS